MIKSITIINNFGDKKTIELGAPETSGLWIKSIKGIGPGKANINVTDLATSDGGIYNSARSEVRNITLSIGFVPYNVGEGPDRLTYSVEDVRRDLYKWFAKKRPIEFIINMEQAVDKYTVRKINLGCSGYVESNEPDIFNKQEVSSVSIICPDPNMYLYDDNGKIISDGIDFSSVADGFTWNTEYSYDNPPFETKEGYSNEVGQEYFQTEDEEMKPGKEYFELIDGQYVSTDDINEFDQTKTYYEYQSVTELATITAIAKKQTMYDGEIEIGLNFRIYILGEVSGLSLYKFYDAYNYDAINIDDDAISLAVGSGLVAGDEIRICTINGKKSAYLIREAVTYNIMNALGRNPAWMKLDQGLNTFSYGATTGSENVTITIEYSKAYEGV